MSNSTERSTILLLCLSEEHSLYSLPQPSVRDLHRIFSYFGPLRKLIVFSKKLVFKAFLEFDDMLSAQRAREMLNDRSIEPFGRARLYYSALQELDHSNKFLEYWDSSERPSEMTPVRKPFAPLSDFGNSFRFNAPSTPETRFDSGEKQGVAPIGSGNVGPGPMGPMGLGLGSGPLGLNLGPSQTPAKLSDFFEQLEKDVPSESSPVVLVSNVDSEFGSARELLNLFGCFGFVTKVLLMKNLRKALIEFRHPSQASRAVSEVNQAHFTGLKIKANFSKYRKVDLKKNNKSENSQQFNEVIVPSSAQNRFGEFEMNRFLRVSRSLLISCDRTFSSVRHLDIYLALQEVATPLSIKVVHNDKEGSQFLMVVAEFADVDRAVLVLVKLHGFLVKNAPLTISFCS